MGCNLHPVRCFLSMENTLWRAWSTFPVVRYNNVGSFTLLVHSTCQSSPETKHQLGAFRSQTKPKPKKDNIWHSRPGNWLNTHVSTRKKLKNLHELVRQSVKHFKNNKPDMKTSCFSASYIYGRAAHWWHPSIKTFTPPAFVGHVLVILKNEPTEAFTIHERRNADSDPIQEFLSASPEVRWKGSVIPISD